MKKTSLRYAFLILAACLVAGMVFIAGCTGTQKTSTSANADKLDGFDAFVTGKMAEYEVPGAVVGIVENDTVVYLKGFGVREAGRPEKVDPDTRFQIASVSKYFTGAAIGTLVDEGKLDWDTPVVTYLPGFALKDRYAGQHATLRDMLAHRAGFKSYDGELLGRVGYSNSEILQRIQYLEPGTSFREKYRYSNVGYFIAGEVAAKADNRSWEDLTDARIIRPLTMTRSGAHPETLYLDDNHVAGHAGTGGDIHTIPLEEASLPAAGQVVSTGRDMTQFMRMMLNDGSIDGKQILTPKTVKDIHAASLVAGASGPLGDQNGAVGLGCDSYHFLGERVIEKNGALDGVRSVVVLIPGKKSGIVVIANKQLTAFPEAVRDEFLERYIGKIGVDLQARENASQAGWNSLIKNPTRPADAGPATISPSAIAGTYTSTLYGILQVNQGSDAGNMTFGLGPDRYPGNLTHWTNNTWYLTFPNPDDQVGYLTFAASPTGTVTGFTSDEFGPFTRA
ncbi:serine hydrolase domain-containing protein [Methanoregula sp.]|uniref:serine hydrolase domain-containing protein n=1 Tax=Methanoregula sp. TaxID=2052170 RepID=UPI0023701507|nr:serine hydrolase domain-containing protein [Methanoregula sp.]MDD1687918.1 beta-lactamase family protein [Methanoregula sp.]